MNIKDIIKKTNVSTILILPIFKEIATDITYRLTQYYFHLIPLLYEYGLLKTYCYSYLSRDNNSIFLVFDKDQVNRKMSNTNKPGQTLNNILIGSKYFKGLDIVDDRSIYNLEIPKEFDKDIELIKKGKYSEVSEDYKKRILISGNVLKKSLLRSELAYDITKENLSFSICSKSRRIKDHLEEVFLDGKTKIADSDELYDKFSSKKELLTEEILKKL